MRLVRYDWADSFGFFNFYIDIEGDFFRLYCGFNIKQLIIFIYSLSLNFLNQTPLLLDNFYCPFARSNSLSITDAKNQFVGLSPAPKNSQEKYAYLPAQVDNFSLSAHLPAHRAQVFSSASQPSSLAARQTDRPTDRRPGITEHRRFGFQTLEWRNR